MPQKIHSVGRISHSNPRRAEKHLRSRLGELFPLEFDLLLYDVTSTYFEGECAANPKAQRGYSRDKRPDCKQVCIALVVTHEGVPFGYEVFAGNRHDAKTLEDIVTAMEKKYGRAQRVWVFDRGVVSEENLKYLREHDGRYLVGTPRIQLRRFEQELLGQGWSEVVPGVEVKLVNSPDGTETFVLAKSRDRAAKEQAMHQRFVDRIEAGLKTIPAGASRGWAKGGRTGRPPHRTTAGKKQPRRRLLRCRGQAARSATRQSEAISDMATTQRLARMVAVK